MFCFRIAKLINIGGFCGWFRIFYYFCWSITEKRMKIIADCGSTKADWALMDGHGVQRMSTVGMNPVHQNVEQMAGTIAQVARVAKEADEVFFYGAGCAEMGAEGMERAIKMAFDGHAGKVSVYSDMLGAARSLLGNQPGMVCILGTGSNSCFYDGTNITANVPPLGYVLGDEGSGVAMGKELVNALYKGRLGDELRHTFERETGLSYNDIINNVYQKPNANRFLGSLSRFVGTHKNESQALRQLVVDNFREFIVRNLPPYNCLSLNAVGSIAYHFRSELEEACDAEGYKLCKVAKSPICGLMEYHGADQDEAHK